MEDQLCNCGGPIKATDREDVFLHACRHKIAPGTSYYDGVDRFVEYKRIQVNPDLTGGVVRYQYWVNWS